MEQTIDIGDLFEELDHFQPGTCDPLDAEDPSTPNGCLVISRTYRFRIFGPTGQVAQVERTAQSPDEIVYLHADHLGSATAITDGSGNRK